MSESPPLVRDQRRIDAEHLKLLAVFHFVLAALSVFGLGFLFLHWAIMHAVMGSPEMWKNAKAAPPPDTLMAIFRWFYAFAGSGLLAVGIGNLISGWCLLKRRHRTFSLVISGVNCLCFPFGTTLAVFSFIILLRGSVADLYNDSRSDTVGQGA